MGARRPSRRVVLTLTASVAALGSIGAAIAVNSVAGETSPSTASAPEASAAPRVALTPAPAPTPEGDAVPAEQVQPAITGYLERADTLAADTDLAAFGGIVSGAALDELKAQQLEFSVNGWSLTGQTKVDGVSVLQSNPAGDPPTATVQACLDSSDVVLVGEDGEPVWSSGDAPRRALNIYGLEYRDGGWLVVSHTFPSDPTC